MGAGGSGKGFVSSDRWLKYMPGGGATPKLDQDAFKRELTEAERGLSNLKFEKTLDALRRQGIEIQLEDANRARTPFKLYTYDQQGGRRLVDPKDWKTDLPPQIYEKVVGLKEVVFSTPVHELPSYWRQVNPDTYKEELAGFMKTEPGYVHQMSSDMAAAYLKAALETGDPIVIDGTGSKLKEMTGKIKAAKDKGYRTSLVCVFVPLTVNQIRNALRERNVDPNQIVSQWKLITKNYAELRSMVDVAKVIINRDDDYDIKAYRKNKETVDGFIRSKTDYANLYELIAAENPSELSEWASLLKPEEGADDQKKEREDRFNRLEEKRKERGLAPREAPNAKKEREQREEALRSRS
jgi:predicted kinase